MKPSIIPEFYSCNFNLGQTGRVKPCARRSWEFVIGVEEALQITAFGVLRPIKTEKFKF